MSKILTLDKTVLTEFKVQVVDINLRQRYAVGSMSCKVASTAKFVTSDVTIGPSKNIEINDITSVVVINSLEPFLMDITKGLNTMVDVECSGLYIFYGKLDRIVLKTDGTPLKETRLSYLYS